MYEQVSHSRLNVILDRLGPRLGGEVDLRHFLTRLGANFYAIHGLFEKLYGNRPDFLQHLERLVEVMAEAYANRSPALEEIDRNREANHEWFLSQEWVGMALYVDGFAGDLRGFKRKLPYLHELGINMVHMMPILECPKGASDGGYAVSNFRNIDERIGTLQELREIAEEVHESDMLLTLDVVLNHTSNEHVWAQKARSGDPRHLDYYYTFEDRDVPDMFEESMPEIFPETAPGNFTWDDEMGRWVMTVFNEYQWDLNYSNPAVFCEMLDIILYWANMGADILRLDAVGFLWKKIGTTCQNLREAHLILQLLKDCCQVTTPGVLFIAEAIMAPLEIIKYFGEDAVVAKECEIAYNATLMALLWDGMATHNARLLNQGIRSLPDKLERATWLNYVRCHDDIGLGFADDDIAAAGYDPHAHRQFLIHYLTGEFEESKARGLPFGRNPKTGDARIAGSLASLVGLEAALEASDDEGVEKAVRKIVMLHGIILSFGGLPLLYYGDELGTVNDHSFEEDENKADDARWIHRPGLSAEDFARRLDEGTPAHTIFQRLKQLIAIRKKVNAFADFNNRDLLDVDNEHLFAFRRTHEVSRDVVVIANFDARPQIVEKDELGHFRNGELIDLATGEVPHQFHDRLVVPPFRFYWLSQPVQQSAPKAEDVIPEQP